MHSWEAAWCEERLCADVRNNAVEDKCCTLPDDCLKGMEYGDEISLECRYIRQPQANETA